MLKEIDSHKLRELISKQNIKTKKANAGLNTFIIKVCSFQIQIKPIAIL